MKPIDPNSLKKLRGHRPVIQSAPTNLGTQHLPLGAIAWLGELGDVNRIMPNGLTPLQIAVIENRADHLQWLLQAGAQLDYAPKGSKPPLRLALLMDRLPLAELLLRHNAPLALAHDQHLPQQLVSQEKQAALLLLAQYGMGWDFAPWDEEGNRNALLAEAISQDKPAMLRWLLQAGANPNGGNEQPPPLHSCCWGKGNLQHANILLGAGADVNGCGADGITALMVAALGNKAEMVEWLLRHGANSQQRDQHGHKAADYAKMNKHYGLALRLSPVGQLWKRHIRP